jgi:hypothetical protein
VLLTPRDALGNPNASFSMGAGADGQLSVRVMVEDSDAEQTTAIMTPDIAKTGRLKVCSAACCLCWLDPTTYSVRYCSIFTNVLHPKT